MTVKVDGYKSLCSAQWIAAYSDERAIIHQGSAPLFRRNFNCPKKPIAAELFITALGIFEAYINGIRTDDTVFSPGWTEYKKRVQYMNFDISNLVKEGENDFFAYLGAGWYAGHAGMCFPGFYGAHVPKLKYAIVLRYEDSDVVFCSDGMENVCTNGPILYNDLLMGEKYDATKEVNLQDREEVNAASWHRCHVLQDIDIELSEFIGEPVREVNMLDPISLNYDKTSSNSVIVDFGQNIAGVIKLTISTSAGALIKLRYAEMLNSNGTLYTDNLRTAKAKDFYIAKGTGIETYKPHFTFHGFRYAEIICDEPFTIQSVTAIVISNDLLRTGYLTTSDKDVNRLLENAYWGQRGNFISIPTDCPQRDERLGWTGDVQIFARSGCYIMNSHHFLRKWLRDVRDSIRSNGAVPDVCPDMLHFGVACGAWADAIAVVPMVLYEMYGDISVLEENFDAIKNWVDYCIREAQDSYLRPDYGYGDWLNVDDYTDKSLIANAFWHNSLLILLKCIRLLNKQDYEFYENIGIKIRSAYAAAFIKNGDLVCKSQTAYILTLRMKMVEDKELCRTLAKKLVLKINARNNFISCGFLGVAHICPVLTEYGYHELAYKLLLNKEYPSWCYSVQNGATTIWERWNGWSKEYGFSDASMNSFNHYVFGSIVEWVYAYAAGIRHDENNPGFANWIFSPYPSMQLANVKASFATGNGVISVDYTVVENRFHCVLHVPEGSVALIRMPDYLDSIIINDQCGSDVKSVSCGVYIITALLNKDKITVV